MSVFLAACHSKVPKVEHEYLYKRVTAEEACREFLHPLDTLISKSADIQERQVLIDSHDNLKSQVTKFVNDFHSNDELWVYRSPKAYGLAKVRYGKVLSILRIFTID